MRKLTHIAVLLCYLHCCVSWTSKLIPSIGRPADMGWGYDEMEDTFVSIKPFLRSLVHDFTSVLVTPSVDSKFKAITNERDKMKVLDLSLEAKASIMSGRVEVKAGFGLLMETSSSDSSVSAFLVYKATTAYESLNIKNPDLKENLNFDGLEDAGSKSIVIGIQWGAFVVVQFTKRISSTSTAVQTRAELEAAVSSLANSANAGVSVQALSSHVQKFENVEYNIQGDIFPSDIAIGSYSKLIEVLNSIPALIKESNSGKGSPTQYEVLKIANFQKIAGYEVTVPFQPVFFDDDSDNYKELVAEVFRSYMEYKEIYQRFDLACKTLHNNEDAIPGSDLKTIAMLQTNVMIQKDLFSSKVRKTLKDIKSGHLINPHQFTEIRRQHENAQGGPIMIDEWLSTKFKLLEKKISDKQLFLANDVKYLEKNEDIQQIQAKNMKYGVRFLMGRDEWKAINPYEWGQQMIRFIQKEGTKYYIDCDTRDKNDFTCRYHTDGFYPTYTTMYYWLRTHAGFYDQKLKKLPLGNFFEQFPVKPRRQDYLTTPAYLPPLHLFPCEYNIFPYPNCTRFQPTTPAVPSSLLPTLQDYVNATEDFSSITPASIEATTVQTKTPIATVVVNAKMLKEIIQAAPLVNSSGLPNINKTLDRRPRNVKNYLRNSSNATE